MQKLTFNLVSLWKLQVAKNYLLRFPEYITNEMKLHFSSKPAGILLGWSWVAQDKLSREEYQKFFSVC